VNNIKLSKWNIIVPFSEKDVFLLFNTATRAVIQIHHELYELIRQHKLNDISKFDLKILERSGFVVDSYINEDLTCKYIINRMKYNTATISITLIMTYGCNCSCVYCYEKGLRQSPNSNYFSEKLCENLIKWLEKRILTSHVSDLKINFHGGEPLLKIEKLLFVASQIRNICDRKGIKYRFTLTTNGTLLSSDAVDALYNVGIKSVMITLDGPAEIHDQRRFLINGKETFSLIKKNILSAINKLDVNVLIVVDWHNSDSIYELIDILSDEGILDKLCGIYAVYTKVPEDNPLYMTGKEFEELWWESIQPYIIQKGFKPKKEDLLFRLHRGACISKGISDFVIDLYGDVYKCIGGAGREEFKIGNLKKNFNIIDLKSSQFIEKDICINDEDCVNCKYYPMCLGGCRFDAQTKLGDLNQKICMKDQLEVEITNALKSIYIDGNYR